mgnify:FL=1
MSERLREKSCGKCNALLLLLENSPCYLERVFPLSHFHQLFLSLSLICFQYDVQCEEILSSLISSFVYTSRIFIITSSSSHCVTCICATAAAAVVVVKVFFFLCYFYYSCYAAVVCDWVSQRCLKDIFLFVIICFLGGCWIWNL